MSDNKKPRGRFIARILDRKTVRQIAPDTFVRWLDTSKAYKGTGYRAGQAPPETGVALVQSPYSDWYNLTWGLAPNQDMPKWRWMFRARPEIRRGMDMRVILSVGRGGTVQCDADKDVEDYANQLMIHLNMKQMLQELVSDMLVYGTAYAEKVRSVPGEEQEGEDTTLQPIEKRMEASEIPRPELSRDWSNYDLDVEDPKEAASRLQSWVHDIKAVDGWIDANRDNLEFDAYAKKDRHEQFVAGVKDKNRRFKAYMSDALDRPSGTLAREEDQNWQPDTGELVELKPLDPLWMRICRDAFSNVIGYVQWGLTPIPQAIISEKLVVFRWMPKSWAHENAYGTSMLMPVQRHISFLVQAEEDMKVFWHQYAKPMLVGKGGTPEAPLPQAALANFQRTLQNRGPTTDVIVPGNYSIEMIQSGAGKGTSQTFSLYVKYLREKVYECMGIPSVLMNLPGDTTRATSDVTLQAFIADEEMIQEYVGEQVLDQILEPEVRMHFASKYPDGRIPQMKMVFAPVLEEDRNKKFDRITKGVGMAPFMTINEARQAVGLDTMTGPPEDPDKYDKIPEEPVGPAQGQSISNFLSPSRNPETNESERTGDRQEMLQKLDRTDAKASAVLDAVIDLSQEIRDSD